MKKVMLCGAAVAALSFASSAAMAFEAGDLVFRAGITNVSPDEESGKVYTDYSGLGETALEASVNSDTQLGLNLVYFYDQHWAVEVLAATPFAHDLDLQNDNLGLGNGSLAEAKQLPPTVSVLYYFNDGNQSFQPYAGVGINYTTFFEEEFTSDRKAQGFSDLDIDDSWGLSAQIGFDYQLSERWLVNASVRYIDIDTTANFKLGGENSYIDVDIDPIVSSLMIGYRF